MVKARHGGADYLYSLLLGYVDAPSDIKLDDGVYYNEYAKGQKIAMPCLLYTSPSPRDRSLSRMPSSA